MIKRYFPLIIYVILFIAFCGCVQTRETGDVYYSFTDDLENKVVLLDKPQKVVAAMGSYGELWLLSGGKVTGITEDAVSERNLEFGGDVKIIGGVKEPNLEIILSLSPDFVILSAEIDSHVKIGETLTSAGIAHAYFKTNNFDQYLNMLKICTSINDKPELYEKYGVDVQSQIGEVIDKAASYAQNPKVLLIRSMTANAKALKDEHMIGAILKDLHTENIASKYPSLLEDLSMEIIISENPDFIFITTMGNAEKAMDTLRVSIMANPAWDNLSAVRNDKVFILPKDLFQYKPNARWGESYEYLEKIIYENYVP